MSRIMFQTINNSTTIKTITIARESEKTVWIQDGNKMSQWRKICDSWQFHDTWKQAQEFLIKKKLDKIDYLEKQLLTEKQQLQKIMVETAI